MVGLIWVCSGMGSRRFYQPTEVLLLLSAASCAPAAEATRGPEPVTPPEVSMSNSEADVVPDDPLGLVLRFVGPDDAPSAAGVGTTPLGLELCLENRASTVQRVSLSSPARHGEDMRLSLTPAAGGAEVPFRHAQKHFEGEGEDEFSINPQSVVCVHVDQFSATREEPAGYFLMWGVGQIFDHVAPGGYLAAASFTIREGSWTGTLRSEPVLITLPPR